MDDDLKIAAFILLIFLLLPVFFLFIIFKPGNEIIVFYLFGGLLALLGIFVFMGKGMWLVAGFNTMSPKEKEEYENEYDTKKVQKTLGVMFLLLGGSMLLLTTDLSPFITSSLIFGIIIVFIIIMNVFQSRFMKK